MPKPRPLPGAESAKKALAHRLTRPADRLRQLLTRFGLRSKRVFLVWTSWGGEERGEGDPYVLARVELLPTPRVADLSVVTRNAWSAGQVPIGTIRVDQISAGAYTEDNLRGLVIPSESAEAPRASAGAPLNQQGTERTDDPRVDFYYEIVEDGRGDNPALPQRYRLFGGPHRAEGSLYFALVLQRAGDDPKRDHLPAELGDLLR